jgi:hypothetical protein
MSGFDEEWNFVARQRDVEASLCNCTRYSEACGYSHFKHAKQQTVNLPQLQNVMTLYARRP